MKPEPLHVVMARIGKRPLAEQIADLRKIVATLPPRSVLRREFQSLLEVKVLKQLRHEKRVA